MKEQEMIDLLRHYRHDWLNELQLLIGYVQMGKIDKVEEKLKENVSSAQEERMLSNLNVPKTALWMISFNWRYDNFRIKYNVGTLNKDISEKDKELHNLLEALMQLLTQYGEIMELYQGNINIFQEQELVKCMVSFVGTFNESDKLVEQLKQLDGNPSVTTSLNSDELNKYTITWVLNKRGDL